jgi:hypothetical protein
MCGFWFFSFLILSPYRGKVRSDESESSGGENFVNWFFNMERKKILPLVTLFFGSVIMAGRERKSFCGAFKA